jgi:hypothetical protein
MFYLGDQVDDVTTALVGVSISEAQRQGVPVSVLREESRTRSGIFHPEVIRLGASVGRSEWPRTWPGGDIDSGREKAARERPLWIPL